MNNDELYPNREDEVYNPMRTDLDGGGYKIINLNQLDLTHDGAINGVITINGLPYPPPYTPLPASRNQEFLFPTGLSIFGDGTSYKLFTVYDNTAGSIANSQLDPLFNNTMTGLNIVLLTIFVNVTVGGASSSTNQGKMGFSLIQNGSTLVANVRSEFLIPPLNTQDWMITPITLTFPITCPVTSPLKLELWAYGGYNYTYYFNANYFHPGDAQPTVCRALGLR